MNQDKNQNLAEKLAYTILNNTYMLGPRFNYGGYGNLYYAEDKTGNAFAIKVSSLEVKNKPEDRRQKILRSLILEDEMMMICESNFTMKCIQALTHEELKLKFIVMELCEFGSLEDLIFLKGHLSEEEAKIILKHNLCGLAQIHRHGLYHRDIKSSNVCFSKYYCVICDFGCSKQFLNDEQKQNWRASYRKNGTVTGTIISQSPEMLAGQGYGLKTDLWGIGIVFYQMLTGVPPFVFEVNLTNQKAVEFIRQNLQSIYEPAYIDKNLKKIDMLGRGNNLISPPARRFLQKLLVFDQKSRVSWRDLINQPYLVKEQQKSESIKDCFLPLKDVDWKQFICGIEKLCLAQGKLPKTQINMKQKTIKVVGKMEKLDIQTSKLLKKRANQLYANQQNIYREIKIIDFEMKRINLLLNFRGYLEELQRIDDKLKCDKVALLVMMFCFLKLQRLLDTIAEKKLEFIKERLQLNQLMQLISRIYEADQKSFQEDHEGNSPTKIFKSLIFYSQQKIDFYNAVKKPSFETVFENIQEQSKKLYNRMKISQAGKKIENVEFFEQAEMLLRADYQPGKDEAEWRQWKSFGSIVQYIADVSKKKK